MASAIPILLTVAPTGSTGTMVGVSPGLEPYFSFTYYRSGRLGKFIEVKADIVQEYLDRESRCRSGSICQNGLCRPWI